jgi:hypothetical protein
MSIDYDFPMAAFDSIHVGDRVRIKSYSELVELRLPTDAYKPGTTGIVIEKRASKVVVRLGQFTDAICDPDALEIVTPAR